jgi:hypoxanthine-DNA glycosylase
MESKGLKIGFPAILNIETRIMVLGSLPSEESIKQQRYYANPQNQFWTIMYAVLNAGKPAQNYDERVELLLNRDIGLWDVLHSAIRKGSSDSKIQNPIPNDLRSLLERYPRIDRILLNGTKAWTYFKKYNRSCTTEAIYVPSSSPIPGKNVLSLELKIKRWHEAVYLPYE